MIIYGTDLNGKNRYLESLKTTSQYSNGKSLSSPYEKKQAIANKQTL